MLSSLSIFPITLRSFALFRFVFFFFFNDTATTEIYTLSLHDALPICLGGEPVVDVLVESLVEFGGEFGFGQVELPHEIPVDHEDRKSTRLNSSHQIISYAVFCLKKKKERHKKSIQHRTSV